MVQDEHNQRTQDKCSLENDAVSKVLGPDKRGHARGLGYGASIAKEKKLELQRDLKRKHDAQLHDMNSKLENVHAELQELKNLLVIDTYFYLAYILVLYVICILLLYYLH